MATFVDILIVTVVATVITDVYEWMLERWLGKTRDWHLVGRWVARLPQGKFVLNPRDDTLAISGETALGWAFHYGVGLVYIAIYVVGVSFLPGNLPPLVSAVAFGMVTVAAPWFILMPALGVGLWAVKADNPAFVRVTSFSVHTVFGIAIYVGVVFVQAL